MSEQSDSDALTSFAQVKALAEPLRYQVYEHLVRQAATAKQLAQQLGVKPTRLYHHFKVLEEVGLIQQVRTEQKRGTTEKYFKAVVQRLMMESRLLEERPAMVVPLLTGVMYSTADDLLRLGQPLAEKSATVPPIVKRLLLHLTPEKVERLRLQLEEWLQECETASSEETDEEYAVTVAFYPRSITPVDKDS